MKVRFGGINVVLLFSFLATELKQQIDEWLKSRRNKPQLEHINSKKSSARQ